MHLMYYIESIKRGFMSVFSISDEVSINQLIPLFSFRTLNQFSETCSGYKALADQVYSKLLTDITPLLNEYTWLSEITGDTPAIRIGSLYKSLFREGFDIIDLSPTRESIINILNRVDLTRAHPDYDIQLMFMYHQIPDADTTILAGAPVEQSRNIRRWMDANRAALAEVTTLNLSGLSLTTVLHELEIYFPSLQTLNLRANRLTTVPDFSHLPSLHTLDLESNRLTTVPDFSHLPSLHTLALSDNRLTTVPDFSHLPSLHTLQLAYNQLTTVPDFAHLPSLHTLLLQDNQLTTIPDFSRLPLFEI